MSKSRTTKKKEEKVDSAPKLTHTGADLKGHKVKNRFGKTITIYTK